MKSLMLWMVILCLPGISVADEPAGDSSGDGASSEQVASADAAFMTQLMDEALAAAVAQDAGEEDEQESDEIEQDEVSDEPSAQSELDTSTYTDLTNLNLSGSDVMVEIVGGNIVITGNETDLDILEALVKRLDEDIMPKSLEMVVLEKRDAKEVAQRLQQAVQAMSTTSTKQRPEDKIDIFSLSNNILLISAPGPRVDEIASIARMIDEAPDRIPLTEPMKFYIRHRLASEAAEKLKEVIDSLRSVQGIPPGEKYQILPNDADNSILIVGLETSERDRIEQLLEAIDVEAAEDFGSLKLVIFPLLNANAEELAEVFVSMMQTPEGRQSVAETIRKLTVMKRDQRGEYRELPPLDLEKPFRMIPDPGTNSLIVATVESNVDPIGQIIGLLDDVPDAVEMGLLMFPLKYADAESVAELLTDVFKEGQNLTKPPRGKDVGAVGDTAVNQAFGYEVTIAADIRTNILFVAGRPEQMAIAQNMVEELDVPSNSLKFPLQLVFLGDNIDAARVGQIIAELFDKRLEALKERDAGPGAIERERIFLAVDARSNALILSASEENVEEIRQITEELDVAPDALIDQIRIITCHNTSAADLQSKIEELWQRKADMLLEGAARPEPPVIVADARSNSLVIASTPEDFVAISRLVDTLEAQELAPIAEIRLIPLNYNNAQSVADMMQNLFEERMKQRLAQGQEENPSDRVALDVDEATNTILVAASPENYQEMERLIRAIDAEHTQFRIYPLTYASAGKLAPKMQEMFDARAAGDRGGDTRKVLIEADEGSNSLITSGAPDQQAQVQDLLSLLDRPSTIAQQFRIFPLRHANAESLSERLDSLFQAGQGSARTDVTAVEPEPRSNSLIVWASPTEMENIAEIIEKLDTNAPIKQMEIALIRLEQALAEDFAELLDNTLNPSGQGGDREAESVILSFEQINDDGTKALRQLVRQDITITPDPYTNSLLVMAPAESMGMLKSMIREFDKVRPQTAEIRLFGLANADAEELKSQLEELFSSTDTRSGELERQLLFGAAVGAVEGGGRQELAFAADRRTNTIMAAGTPVDLKMVESLIRELDSQDVDDRINLVHKPGYLNAAELASAIEKFNQSETDRLGDIGDEMSAMRQAERAVTVVSVGEESSDSLIVGISPRYYEEYMNLIYQLDRPEPQVMIQALIAEVTLDDSIDLGLEFAVQDLLFSENATLGANGTLQGHDFDFVGGTDLGTGSIGGGFSFATTGEDFSLLFRALQTNSEVEVLSRPTIMVRNNEEAEIIIGDRVPTVSGTQINPQGSTSSTVEYNDVGIQLAVLPQINPDGYVSLDVRPEISAQTANNVQLTEGLAAPIFRERSADTNVTLKDGETVVIGGLITDRREQSEAKIPILGDLPGIGWLFRTTNDTTTKTELLIVLTVDVIWSEEDARDISIKQRDMGHLPQWMKRSPLMEGLRILPAEGETFGPVEVEQVPTPTEPPADEDRGLYGPSPGRYGPELPKDAQVTQGTQVTQASYVSPSSGRYGPTIPKR